MESNQVLPAISTAGRPATQGALPSGFSPGRRTKPCRRGPFGLQGELKSESKIEIPI